MNHDDYIREIKILRVVDGDTLDVEVNLGYRITTHQRIRLLGVNTPELTSKDTAERDRAFAAKTFVQSWTAIPSTYYMKSEKSDSFGRWLGTIWRATDNEQLNQKLLNENFAVEYKR